MTMIKRWRERDSAKLRKLEREFELLKLDYELMTDKVWQLERKVNEKEVTYTQRIKVQVDKPFDYDGWYP